MDIWWCGLVTQLGPALCYPMWLARLLCPWDFSGKNTGVGCHFLLQGIFPTKGWEPTSPALQAGSSFAGAFFTVEPPGKEITCNVGDLCSIPGQEDPLEKGMAAHSVFLPGEPHGQRSLAGYGYSPWDHRARHN